MQNAQVYYIHADHLGTPRVITEPATSTVVWRWDSDPFGTTPANDDPDGDGTHFTYNLRFPGQYYDAETGKHYNTFRDYDSETGRYIESDPIGLRGGLNTYAYVGENPIDAGDPTGQFCGSGICVGILWCASNAVCRSGVLAIVAGGVYSQSNSGNDSSGGFPRNGGAGDYCLLNPDDPLCEQSDDNLDGCDAAWHQGSYSSSRASLEAHFEKHGSEVGARDAAQYLRKAQGFQSNLRGAARSQVDGETSGVIRYRKNGKYIDVAPDGRIISFGR